MHYRAILLAVLITTSSPYAFSQNLLGQEVAITTAVPFLTISPDARHAALGDAGVATSPDANASYWNAGKLVFIEEEYGATVSFTPWLGKLVNDMWVGYLSGFYKFSREQAVSVSLKYFDLGDITFTDGPNISDITGQYNPREFALDATYSRMLSENLGIGITGRYIYSNLIGTSPNIDAKPGKSVAADIGMYYTKPLEWRRFSTLSLGATITNIGAKLSYTDNANADFLPTNLRIGSALKTELDPYNSITFALDFNKLMVPSPPIRDSNGQITKGSDPDRPLLDGMFSSFTDAPNGAKEELQEVMTSVGIEYWYSNKFAARLGYFNEAKNKGNRKYMTIGVGFNKDKFGIDIAYLVPTAKREHPLAETLRFTLLFHIKGKDPTPDESVTDNP